MQESGFAATRWREAYGWVDRLLDMDEPSRDSVLESLARDNPNLYPHVATLVRAHRELESAPLFLEPPRPGDDVLTLGGGPRAVVELTAGQALGPYRLERPLGAGGMGEVWLARRADGLFEAPVALKLLHAHLGGSSSRKRFVREGRILGQLSHPNVARLLDAGELPDARLYLALEYVEGERLDQHCDRQRLGLEDRVRLFRQVCAAVSHAHAHLVVHRDLKPSNLLVSGGGEIKLLDFGIAKLIEDDPTGGGGERATELTRLGGRVLTPEYAAPEQILGQPVSVATDVYSLGVLLYALLCGRRPYGATATSVVEVERAVLEAEIAPPSATRAATLDTEAPDTVAKLRSMRPAVLAQSLRGDLDTIVLKAMKRAPAERYASVQALSEDLLAWLDHRPIAARPDRLSYRVRKYLRRHRVAVGAAAVVALAIVAGIAGTLSQARRAEREAAAATARAVELRQVVDFQSAMLRRIDVQQLGAGWVEAMRGHIAEKLDRDRPLPEADAKRLLDDFDRAIPWAQPSEVARQSLGRFVLEPARSEIAQRFGSQPRVESALRTSVAESYADLGLNEVALAEAERSLAALGPAAARDDLPEALEARLLKARVLARNARMADGLVEAKAVVDARARTLGADHPQTFKARRLYVDVLEETDEAKAAQPLAETLLADERRVLGDEDPGTLETESILATIYSDLGDDAKAADTMRHLLAVQRRVLGSEDRATLATMMKLVGFLIVSGHAGEARTIGEELLGTSQRVLGEGHPNTLSALANLAVAVDELGDKPRAFQLKEQAWNAAQRYQGEDSRLFQIIATNYGVALDDQGRWEEALVILGSVADVRERTLGPDKPGTLHARYNMASELVQLGREAEAQAVLSDVLDRQRHSLGDDHRETLQTWISLAVALDRGGDPARSLAELDAMAPVFDRVHGKDAAETLRMRGLRGLALCHLGRLADAEAALVPMLGQQKAALGPRHPQVLETLMALAETRFRQKRPAEAAALAQEALEGGRAQFGTNARVLLPNIEAGARYEAAAGHVAAAAALGAEARRLRDPPKTGAGPATVQAVRHG